MLLTLPLLAQAVEQIRVDIFLSIECPISNRYVPELNRLANTYQPRGIAFCAYFPEPGLTQIRLDQWAKDFAIQFPVVLDTKARQARSTGATLTPEAAIFKASRLLYRGRIDDRYVSWGKSRPEPSHRDLAETLDQLLAGKQPAPRFTKAWGCFIETGTHP